jgi:hypothetical protein
MKQFILFALCLLPLVSWSQSSFAPLNEDYYQKIDRYEVKAGRIYPEIFTSVKQYKRSAIIAFMDSVEKASVFKSKADLFNTEYLHNDSWEWADSAKNNSKRPILKRFYRKKSDLYEVAIPEFDLHVNPVLYVGMGKDSRSGDNLYVNTRGIEVRGMIDRKVGFYTYLTDNQMLLPSYVNDQMSLNYTVPHEGFWKSFKNGKAVDFLQARAYISFEATKHINIQFGNDRNFIGNGYRSLIFSDYAPPTLFLKATAKVWKINYMFLLNRMTAEAGGGPSGSQPTSLGYPVKYVAFHHLSINLGKKLNVGLFESVIFNPKDSVSNNKFEYAYLNPVIFYRSLEQQSGSKDNVILGMDFKWNAIRKVSFYGQLVLDEFVLAHIKANDGWWANKYAIQGGVKYIDAFGVSNLDLQGEVNIVRPFTYSHNTQFGSYSNFNQPIAHPLGANFKEVVGILRYQPLPRLNVTGKLIVAQVGRDSIQAGAYNWGGNIFRDNSSKDRNELGNKIGQGHSNSIMYGSVSISYMVKHNLFIDFNTIVRKSKCDLAFYNNNTSITSLALRWNIPQRLYEF